MSLEPFDIDTSPPTSELLDIAHRELRETPELRAASIEELRRLLHNATDLHYRDDDDFLLIFLRPCHFYPESALKMVSFDGKVWVANSRENSVSKPTVQNVSKSVQIFSCSVLVQLVSLVGR